MLLKEGFECWRSALRLAKAFHGACGQNRTGKGGQRVATFGSATEVLGYRFRVSERQTIGDWTCTGRATALKRELVCALRRAAELEGCLRSYSGARIPQCENSLRGQASDHT